MTSENELRQLHPDWTEEKIRQEMATIKIEKDAEQWQNVVSFESKLRAKGQFPYQDGSKPISQYALFDFFVDRNLLPPDGVVWYEIALEAGEPVRSTYILVNREGTRQMQAGSAMSSDRILLELQEAFLVPPQTRSVYIESEFDGGFPEMSIVAAVPYRLTNTRFNP